MNINIIKLCDIDSIDFPNGMFDINVGDGEIDGEIDRLSVRYAEKTEVDTAEAGDVVFCRDLGGCFEDLRPVILFTGADLPDATEASDSVLQKKVGDTVKTEFCGKEAVLKIMRVVRATPVEVNDALISEIGEVNVSTVKEYREYLREKITNSRKKQLKKEACAYVLDELEAGSVFEYNSAKMDEYIDRQIKEYTEMYGEAFVYDDVENVRSAVLSNIKRDKVAEEFCRSRKIEIDMNEIEEEISRYAEIAELTGEALPDRETMMADAVKNQYYGNLFEYIDGIISKRMGD